MSATTCLTNISAPCFSNTTYEFDRGAMKAYPDRMLYLRVGCSEASRYQYRRCLLCLKGKGRQPTQSSSDEIWPRIRLIYCNCSRTV